MILDLSNCVGQAYDGASNMSGRLNGVSKKILSQNPKAIYIHCMAHCLNLCLQDSASACWTINEALALTSEISNFIRASPKHLALFETLQKDMVHGQIMHNIKPLCPTRWTVRTCAILAIIENYSVICAELDTITKESYGEPSRKSCGLLAMMDSSL